jgi:transaldolase
VNRPNLYIKIPGTREGLPAIQHMLYEGINVNITLLFSVDRYEEIAKTYIRALERRDKNGDDIHTVSSVASFFLSRIDVLVDKLLLHRVLPNNADRGTGADKLLGKIAVANAKLAYQSFKDIFQGRSWEKLVDKGARVQRPLWASTSTKNPEYNDVMYVEPLIGPYTVNTMPEETISAFADHGQIDENSIDEGLEDAQENIKMLESLGIDLNQVTQQLEDEGIQKFIDPFNELMTNLNEKSEKFSTKVLLN